MVGGSTPLPPAEKGGGECTLWDGLIITIGAAGTFFGVKVANVKPPKISLDAVDIMKLAGGICRGVLLKDYVVYKKWITE